jgi:hypothetical protein
MVKQMQGEAGYQPEYGLAANMGGSDKIAVVTVLKNDTLITHPQR